MASTKVPNQFYFGKVGRCCRTSDQRHMDGSPHQTPKGGPQESNHHCLLVEDSHILGDKACDWVRSLELLPKYLDHPDRLTKINYSSWVGGFNPVETTRVNCQLSKVPQIVMRTRYASFFWRNLQKVVTRLLHLSITKQPQSSLRKTIQTTSAKSTSKGIKIWNTFRTVKAPGPLTSISMNYMCQGHPTSLYWGG